MANDRPKMRGLADLTDEELRGMLPTGFSIHNEGGNRHVVDDRFPEIRGSMIVRDGVNAFKFTVPKEVLEAMLQSPGAHLEFLDRNRRLALAWIPKLANSLGMGPRIDVHLKELPKLVDGLARHIEAGAAGGKLEADLIAFLDWVFGYHEIVTEFTQRQARDLAVGMREVESSGYARRARQKQEKNPVAAAKYAAKEKALDLWKERHAGKQPRLRTVTQFAIEVQRRWPVLTSIKVIEGWSAIWTKAVKAGETPVC